MLRGTGLIFLGTRALIILLTCVQILALGQNVVWGRLIFHSLRQISQNGGDIKGTQGPSGICKYWEPKEYCAHKEWIKFSDKLPRSEGANKLRDPAPTPDQELPDLHFKREVNWSELKTPGHESLSGIKAYSGSLPAYYSQSGMRELFYVLFPAENRGAEKTLTIWLNGGPGCSSMSGLFLEHGAVGIRPTDPSEEKYELYRRKYSSSYKTSVLFVDNPSGVGYSRGQEKNCAESASSTPLWVRDFVTFLRSFMVVYPEYKDANLYLTGESFAGYYLPRIALGLFDEIPKKGSELNSVKLKGMIVGNPWIDPYSQYKSMMPFLKLHESLRPIAEDKQVVESWNTCNQRLDNIQDNTGVQSSPECERLSFVIDKASRRLFGHKKCMNPYNYLLSSDDCGTVTWPVGNVAVGKFLNDSQALEVLNVRKKPGEEQWSVCTSINTCDEKQIYSDYYTGLRAITKLVKEHEKNFKVTIFVGALDFLCNHLGVEKAVSRIEFNNSSLGMEKFRKHRWYVDGEEAGTYKSYRNLDLIIINDASHMVPIEKPKPFLQLLLTAINEDNDLFSSYLVPISISAVKASLIGVGTAAGVFAIIAVFAKRKNSEDDQLRDPIGPLSH